MRNSTVCVLLTILAIGCIMTTGCQPGSAHQPPTDVEPPLAKTVDHALEKHGDVRNDPYYWLKEREDEEVISYLEAENSYTEAMTAHTKSFEKDLFKEIKGRIKQTDVSVPYKLDDYFYYSRVEDGKDYPIYCRKKGSTEADEEVMLDVNAMAEGEDYFAVRGLQVSMNQNILAYAEDNVGRRIYTIKFKNLATGETLADEIPEVNGAMAWANDDKTLFYAKQDLETLRSHQIYRHVLGSDPAKDELVYQEDDDTFSAYVWRTKSKKFIMIGSFQTLSNEYRYLDADKPDGTFKVFLERQRDHEYNLDHYGDHFFIRTNDQAKNFRLMRTPVAKIGRENWEEVIEHRKDVLLEGIDIFKDQLVVEERKNGLIQIRVMPWEGEEHYLDFGEPAYMAYTTDNYDFDTKVLRYGYSSMTTPRTVYDYDMESKQRTQLKQDEVLGGFDSANYVTERLYADARDGTKVPISLVYRKGFKKNGKQPLLLYGYGSYGNSLDASFRSSRLTLIDRGFVYAIAHVRGGQEMGRHWYDDGKLFKKMNTFNDFIDCGEFLKKEKYADPDRMFAMGGSAGGLLMGAVINLRPDLFTGVVAAVPFVDVITTMLDDSIPLTTGEYDEWGNPNDKAYYDYIMSYSPYDNVEAKEYPHLLVTTGLHDSQVQYWEPAKWVAKLRTMKTGKNRLLLKTNMEAGHGGASGRDKRYEELAFNYAFVLDVAGIGS